MGRLDATRGTSVAKVSDVVIVSEMIHNARIIPLDQRPHLPPGIRRWTGDSLGRWDGDTLVVDTTNFTNKTRFRGSTGTLHVVERYRRPDLGHLEIENTVDDPKAYTKPWSFKTQPVMLKGELMEYICQENNKDVQHLVGK